MIEALDHVHIFCSDTAASARYFREVFEAEEASREKIRGLQVVRLTVAGTTVTLMEASNPAPPPRVGQGAAGLDHFCFLVRDMEGTVEAMRRKGATFSVEPRTAPNGAKVAFVDGPDGIIIELKEWPERP